MDLFKARFSQSQVARATGVQRARVGMWLNRGYLRYVETDGDEDAEPGVGHRLSARTALRIAIMDAVSAFIDASKADAAVVKFMDSGHGPTGENPSRRDPGGLFEDGETVLCVYDDASAEVINVRPDTKASDLPPLRDGRRAALIPMDELHASVLLRLERMILPEPDEIDAAPAPRALADKPA